MLTDTPIGRCEFCGGEMHLGVGHLGTYIYCQDCGVSTEDEED